MAKPPEQLMLEVRVEGDGVDLEQTASELAGAIAQSVNPRVRPRSRDVITGPMLVHRMMDVVIEPLEEGGERAEGGDEGLIPISMSSETKVERYDWWTGERYFEVLSHDKGGVDLSYARDGIPFLMDHDSRIQVGLVENVKLDAKAKVIRGAVRMGNHPNAEWLGKDIRTGIRKKVSVGYDPGNNFRQLEGEGDKIPTRVYTGWRLYEASSVPVPADYDVGVMRSAFEGSTRGERRPELPATAREGQEQTMSGTAIPSAAPTDGAGTAGGAAAPAVIPTRDFDAERKQRLQEVLNVIGMTQDPAKRADLLAQAMREDWSVSTAVEKVTEANIANASAAVPAGRVDLSPKEQKRYSIARALRAMVLAREGGGGRNPMEDAAFEVEVSSDIAKRYGKEPQGIFLPLKLSVDQRAASAFRASVTGNVAGTTSLGGAAVESSVREMIEILREENILLQLGARMMPGLTSNITFPRQITANSWTWEGENPSTAKTETAATFEPVTLSPKTGYGATAISKQWLIQASFDGEQWAREDLARIAALGIDAAGIAGTGSNNQPFGVLNASGVSTQTMGTNGSATVTWANILQYETTLSSSVANRGRVGFLTTPGVRGLLKNTLKNTVSGADYLWPSSNQVNGYPAFVSTNVPSNLTKGTSTTICHGLAFGNWTELAIGLWGEVLDVTVDPFFYATQGMIRVIGTAMVDTLVRHPASFVVTKDLLTS